MSRKANFLNFPNTYGAPTEREVLLRAGAEDQAVRQTCPAAPALGGELWRPPLDHRVVNDHNLNKRKRKKKTSHNESLVLP